MRSLALATFVIALSVVPTMGALPVVQQPTQVLFAPEGSLTSLYGAGLASDGDLLAVAGNLGSYYAGAVFVYRRVDGVWSLEATLPTERIPQVAVDGERIAFADEDSVDVHERVGDEWVNVFRYDTSNVAALALEGSHLAVSNGRRVDIYLRGPDGEWTREDTVLPPEGSTTTRRFGAALAFGREFELIVGEPEVPGGQLPRFHQLLNFGGDWRLHRTIATPDADRSNGFGMRLAYDGNHLVVGAPLAHHSRMPVDPPGYESRTGAAFVFVAQLLPTDGFRFDGQIDPLTPLTGFASAVAVRGEDVLVGDPLYGSVTIYRYSHVNFEWLPADVILHEEPSTYFGGSMGIVDGGVAIGAVPHATAAWEGLTGEVLVPGRVYLYAR